MFPSNEQPGFLLPLAAIWVHMDRSIVKKYSILTMPCGSPVNAQITPRFYDGPYITSSLCELPNSALAGESRPLLKEVAHIALRTESSLRHEKDSPVG
jgi:hypothetical protein